jgi:hypothetical protein
LNTIQANVGKKIPSISITINCIAIIVIFRNSSCPLLSISCFPSYAFIDSNRDE